MLNNFILASKITGILFTIFVVICVFTCCVVAGRADKED